MDLMHKSKHIKIKNEGYAKKIWWCVIIDKVV